MFLASVPDELAVTEPGVGTRVSTGLGETGTLAVGKWVWRREAGSLPWGQGSLAPWHCSETLGIWETGRSELQVWEETCHLVAPVVTASEDQLVISYRTG